MLVKYQSYKYYIVLSKKEDMMSVMLYFNSSVVGFHEVVMLCCQGWVKYKKKQLKFLS